MTRHKELSICIVGDLIVDTTTHLSDNEHITPDQQIDFRAAINIIVGGTSFHLAKASVQQGFSKVSVIGKVGTINGQLDISAQLIARTLNENNIGYVFAEDSQESTGNVMLIYLAEGGRIMISDRGANRSFCQKDITPQLLKPLTMSNVLFISGYCLLVPEQAEAVAYLMQEAKQQGCLVVLDVVPHKIYQLVELAAFRKYTQCVDVLVSELNTINRLFPEIDNIDFFEYEQEFMKRLLNIYSAYIIRITNDMEFICNRHGVIYKGSTGYSSASSADKRGFLDRIAIQRIYDHFEAFQTV